MWRRGFAKIKNKIFKVFGLKKMGGPAAAPAARIFDFSCVKNVYSIFRLVARIN
jgi:hypothetical protein